jgi:hypothetical protein
MSMKAIELTGTVDDKGHLRLDSPVIEFVPGRVRVILLFPEGDDIDEHEWLKAASQSDAFAFLSDPEEDIYTRSDGKPFRDKG